MSSIRQIIIYFILFLMFFTATTGFCEKFIIHEIENFMVHPEGSYCLDWNKNNTLAIGGRSGTIVIISETKATQYTKKKQFSSSSPWGFCGVKKIDAHNNSVIKIKWSPHENKFASVSLDRIIKIWHLDKQDECITNIEHINKLIDLDWNPQPKFKHIIATASVHKIKIWDLNASKAPKLIRHFDDEICSICWHPGGKKIIIGLYNNNPNARPPEVPIVNGKLVRGHLQLFNVYNDETDNFIDATIQESHQETIRENKTNYVMRPSFLFFKNENTILCGECNGYLKFHDLNDFSAGKAFKMEYGVAFVHNVTYNSKANLTAAFCQEFCLFNGKPNYENFVRFWENNESIGKFFLEINPQCDISGMSFCPNGNYLACVFRDGNIHILEIKKIADKID